MAKAEKKARALRLREHCTLCEKGKIAEGTANLIGNFTWIACPCCDGNWKNCRTCQERGD